jgi:uncharacterized protein
MFTPQRLRAHPCARLGVFVALCTVWLAVLPTPSAAQTRPPSGSQAGSQGTVCPPQASLLSAQQASAARDNAKDRGYLWRIRKDGHDSYLYGTLHVGRNDWLSPGPKMLAALNGSDVLALEIDGTNPQVAQRVAQAMQRPGPAVDDALRQRLAQRLALMCLPQAVASMLNPPMQAVMMGIVSARFEGLHAEFGSEVMLTTHARNQGKRVVSLETVQRQFSALMPKTSSEANDMIASAIEQHDKQLVRPMLKRLIGAWERGDFNDLVAFADWCNCIHNDFDRVMLKRINDERNDDMARSIEELHRGGKRIFAAVGAMHMTGDRGLPKLMATRGFAVERIEF